MTIYALKDKVPSLHADTWVAPDANVIGLVRMDERSSVWFGTTIRADHETIHIGKGSNVQENCVLHVDPGYPMTIGENCTIGHKVMLHGCTIGNNSLIGMGATVLNGAKIGENCLIGAGALITEGKEIPDGSVVMGAPGRVVKQLDEKAQKRMAMGAAHYQQNMDIFRDQLTEVTP